MRGLVRLIVIALASIGVACSTPVHVAFDEQQDFARYRTWDWAPGSTYDIDAPHEDVRLLHARVAPLIEAELREVGLKRARGRRADLFVAYRLVLRRDRVSVRTVGAQKTLGDFRGTYIVTPLKTELRTYENSHLMIGFAGPDGRLIWVGQLERRVPRSFEPHLESAVVSILMRFPPPSPAAGRGPAHPPAFQEGRSLLAAMLSEVGTVVDSSSSIDDLR